jgi:hypothetical protein
MQAAVFRDACNRMLCFFYLSSFFIARSQSTPFAYLPPNSHLPMQTLPKRLGNQVLTGPMLAGLAEAYVAAINAGAVPTIATAWQGVAEAESRRAADAAEAAYAATFAESVDADEASMLGEHARALAAAAAVFEDGAVGERAVREANEKRWREACETRWVGVVAWHAWMDRCEGLGIWHSQIPP